jgi:hypothetical protein
MSRSRPAAAASAGSVFLVTVVVKRDDAPEHAAQHVPERAQEHVADQPRRRLERRVARRLRAVKRILFGLGRDFSRNRESAHGRVRHRLQPRPRAFLA